MNAATPIALFVLTLAIAASAIDAVHPQEAPARSGHDRQSPDQRYEWRIETHDPVRYELVAVANQRILATVRDYFYDQDHTLALRHAQSVAVYWNDRSTLVALDEFNYRRAGHLYLFWLQDGQQAKPIRLEALLKPPEDTTEARFCVRQGWSSATRLSIRLAAQLRSGEVISKDYILDLSDPAHPKAQAEP